jgi:hypothetical protein
MTTISASVRTTLHTLGLHAKAHLTTGDVFAVRDELARKNIDVLPADIIQALVDIDKLRPASSQRAATSTVDAARTHGGARNAMIEVRTSAPPTPVEVTKLAIAKAFAAAGISISHLVGEGPRSRSVHIYLRGDFDAAKATLDALNFKQRTIDSVNQGRATHMDPTTGVAIFLVYDNAISGGRDI